MADCLAELRRNAGLRRLIGIEHEEQVPNKWNMSRFEKRLGKNCRGVWLTGGVSDYGFLVQES